PGARPVTRGTGGQQAVNRAMIGPVGSVLVQATITGEGDREHGVRTTWLAGCRWDAGAVRPRHERLTVPRQAGRRRAWPGLPAPARKRRVSGGQSQSGRSEFPADGGADLRVRSRGDARRDRQPAQRISPLRGVAEALCAEGYVVPPLPGWTGSTERHPHVVSRRWDAGRHSTRVGCG